jgi:hypothetical protein
MASSILNSDDGVISGTSGIKAVGGDDGVLVFQSKGTETAQINTDKQIVAAAGTASLPVLTTTGDLNTGIYFPAADNIGFATGGTIRGRWTTDGLCFGSDTAAANALDDYEEGTWTATHTAAANITGTPTYSQTTYTKIGRIVILQMRIDVNVTNANTTSYVVFSGAPFVQAQIATAFGLANNGGQIINGQIYSSGTIFIGAPAASALPSGADIWYATLVYMV